MTFLIKQDEVTVAFSIKSISKGLSLICQNGGGFVFTSVKECEEDSSLIDAADLDSASSDAQLLFAGVIRQNDEKIILSKHSPGRLSPWRTDTSRDLMSAEILKDMGDQSSTVYTDSDTGYHWFVSAHDGKNLFLIITTDTFPWLYGFKAGLLSIFIERRACVYPQMLCTMPCETPKENASMG